MDNIILIILLIAGVIWYFYNRLRKFRYRKNVHYISNIHKEAEKSYSNDAAITIAFSQILSDLESRKQRSIFELKDYIWIEASQAAILSGFIRNYKEICALLFVLEYYPDSSKPLDIEQLVKYVSYLSQKYAKKDSDIIRGLFYDAGISEGVCERSVNAEHLRNLWGAISSA